MSAPSSGTISKTADLELYSDSACKTFLTASLGDFIPGSNADQTIYVKNTGNYASLTLNMSIYDWNPRSANEAITVSWDQEGTRLAPGQVVEAIITPSVSSNVTHTSDFSFKISTDGA